MIKMHENEFTIDEYLVRLLLKSQCPQWANLPLKTIPSSGTDHALYRLGRRFVVRLPRLDGAAKNINKEYEWVPKLAEQLEIPISKPLFKGKPNEYYPSSWLVVQWLEGHNPIFEKENEHHQLAKDLAYFLNDLHRVKLSQGPSSRRGVPLCQLDEETKKALDALKKEMDIRDITALWNELSTIPSFDQNPVWIHGDFLPGNILVQHNRLNSVIDFSDVGLGDPACDLVIAWSLLKPHSRRIFREHLENIDDNTWERGRGWALSIALIMLPYYKHSNPILASLAKQMIENVSLTL
jgi:aminoglycoside phosphotransferase (APT) family kinase protein